VAVTFINRSSLFSDEMIEDTFLGSATALGELVTLGSPATQGIRSIKYEFALGNFVFYALDHIPVESRTLLARAQRKLAEGDPSLITPLEVTAKRMLEDETSLKPTEDRIKVMHKSARWAIDYTISQLVNEGGKVVLPVPNWDFWDKLEGVGMGHYGFNYISGVESNELVDGFKSVAGNKDVGALLLVSPSNPMGYHITEDVCRELDAVAEKNGVKVIIDDLLRGNLPIGQRESIAAYFSEPYVVEGFSHRFGDKPLGATSYILVPEGDKSIDIEVIKQPCASHEMIKQVYDHASAKIVAELSERNTLFDTNLRSIVPDIEIHRASISSITGIITLPSNVSDSADLFSRIANLNGLNIFPVSGIVPLEAETPDSVKKVLRFGVGAIKKENIAEGARYLGRGIKYGF
jgi:DNA-binding transcriptional MocR family regulator